jgi:hypothetical protein
MPATTLDRRVGRSNSATKNGALIGRAAKRAVWAGIALERAARDLDGACGSDGNALSGLAEIVHDEAARVSKLAEEIESRSSVPRSRPTGQVSARRLEREFS